MNKRFQSFYDYKPSAPEFNDREVRTQPDMALSPAEIMVKFAQGKGSSVPVHKGSYDQFPDVSKMTVEEIQIEAKAAAARSAALEERARKIQNAVTELEQRKKVDAILEQRLRDKQKREESLKKDAEQK